MADGCGEHDEVQKADDDLTEMITSQRYPETASTRHFKLVLYKKLSLHYLVDLNSNINNQ